MAVPAWAIAQGATIAATIVSSLFRKSAPKHASVGTVQARGEIRAEIVARRYAVGHVRLAGAQTKTA